MARKSVKVVSPASTEKRAIKNFWEQERVNKLKSGATAKMLATDAAAENYFNKKPGPTPKVKIDSTNPTRQGTTPTPRRAGGLISGGGAGNWRNMFK